MLEVSVWSFAGLLERALTEHSNTWVKMLSDALLWTVSATIFSLWKLDEFITDILAFKVPKVLFVDPRLPTLAPPSPFPSATVHLVVL